MKIPKVNPTMLDRIIAAIDPERGARRLQARTMIALASGGGSYVGADRSRRAQRQWQDRPTSADQATLPALRELRSASRDLVRNNPLAAGAINTITTSVVGTGLSVNPQIAAARLGLTQEQAAAWQLQAKEIFELWATNPLWCDVTAEQTFYELQDLAFRSACESGDLISLLPYARNNNEPFQTKIQLIEADRVCNPDGRADTDTLAGGIEVNEAGRPIRCHVARKHPGAYMPSGNSWQAFEFFGAGTGRRNVLHLKAKLRPGQRRGVPYLAPVIEALKQLGTYTDAEITAAVVSGMFTVFIKKEGPTEIVAPAAGNGSAPAGTLAANEVELSPGAMVELGAGEEMQLANPMRPNEKFDPFVMAILRQIGVALELPFEILIKHFTASYSASRAALLEAWRFFRRRREWLAAHFCQPIYEAVIWEAVASGRLSAPGFLRDPMIRAAYCRASWIGDAPGALNPLDEANAAGRRIEIGISSIEKESIANDGSSFADNHKQQKIELEARARDGLGVVQTSANKGVVSTAAQRDNPAPADAPTQPDSQQNQGE